MSNAYIGELGASFDFIQFKFWNLGQRHADFFTPQNWR
ncbi:MAG: hypothetical protein ACI89D_001653 [Bermanella sp.]|jgi:hypothetical protein